MLASRSCFSEAFFTVVVGQMAVDHGNGLRGPFVEAQRM